MPFEGMKCYDDNIYYFKDSETGQYGVVVTYQVSSSDHIFDMKVARVVLRDSNESTEKWEEPERYFIHNNTGNYKTNSYSFNKSTGKYYKMIYVLDVTKKNDSSKYIVVNPSYYSDATQLTDGNNSDFNDESDTPQADYVFFVGPENLIDRDTKTGDYWWYFRGSYKEVPSIYAYGDKYTKIANYTNLFAALNQCKFKGWYGQYGKLYITTNLFD